MIATDATTLNFKCEHLGFGFRQRINQKVRKVIKGIVHPPYPPHQKNKNKKSLEIYLSTGHPRCTVDEFVSSSERI